MDSLKRQANEAKGLCSPYQKYEETHRMETSYMSFVPENWLLMYWTLQAGGDEYSKGFTWMKDGLISYHKYHMKMGKETK